MISLAILWHHHQPLYRDPGGDGPGADDRSGSVLRPWVRLHAIRDYYSMAALVAERPGIQLAVNLTPVLLEQIDDYVERDRTDRALELTNTPSVALESHERDEILETFFEADWHNQIFPHPRYRELFERRQAGEAFDARDLRDLRMWFNLAWFGHDFRSGPVELVTGERITVHRFVEQGRDFREEDILEMVEDQHRVMRAVVPIHRKLEEEGLLEVTTTPFYHPILPLVMDTDEATLDRPGARLPGRFSYPEDAREQIRRARDDHEERFGRPPAGMWPAEGAVSEESARLLADEGARWIASDRGVLARSGRWGYEVDDPGVLHRPYRHVAGDVEVAVFFRDTELSDRIGFDYQGWEDADEAARNFVEAVKSRGSTDSDADGERIVTVILDGENAWGGYREDGRPFLRSLYRRLAEEPDVKTVTPGGYLDGDGSRGIPSHPVHSLERVHELFTASWIDEAGSEPGVDLGTWIGEEEENRAWEFLIRARRALDEHGGAAASNERAFDLLLAAEGSDWFWWYGADQEGGDDMEFDALFRGHLRGAYRALGIEPPGELDRSIMPRAVIWTFSAPVDRVSHEDRLVIRTNCPGTLSWSLDGGKVRSRELTPSGGVMAGSRRFGVRLGPFDPSADELRFRFRCGHPGCEGEDPCCSPEERRVRIV